MIISISNVPVVVLSVAKCIGLELGKLHFNLKFSDILMLDILSFLNIWSVCIEYMFRCPLLHVS